MKGFFEDASMTGEKELQQLSSKIEDLVHRVDAISDPAVKANATVLVQSLLDLHSAAFQRVTEALLHDGESGRQILERLAADEIVGGLLVLYGLHPDGLDVRLQKAIERARKAIAPHGASIELLDVREGMIHVRLSGKPSGCGSTTRKLQELVENAICEGAPEITKVQIDDAIQSGSSEPLVQLQVNLSALQRA
jgi:Fe-S cluster biogenesis protein NfuA